jgi:hypothetical protein
MTNAHGLILITTFTSSRAADAAEQLLHDHGVTPFVIGSEHHTLYLFVDASEADEAKAALAKRGKEARST